MMVLRLRRACVFYIRRPAHAGRARARSTSGLYKFLLNKWYFDELYDFLFVRPAKWLGHVLWKKRRRLRSSTASGLTASRRGVLDVDAQRRAAADRLSLSLRLRHADRRRRAHHLVHVRPGAH